MIVKVSSESIWVGSCKGFSILLRQSLDALVGFDVNLDVVEVILI